MTEETMEIIEGVVAAVNDRGLRLEGEEAWRNFTRPEWRGAWYSPRRGDLVRLSLGGKGFIKSIALLSADQETGAPPAARRNERRSIERQVALKAAVELARPLAELARERLAGAEQPEIGAAITALASDVIAAADMFASFLEGSE